MAGSQDAVAVSPSERRSPVPFTRRWTRGPRGPFRWVAYVLGVTSFAAAIPTPFYPYYAHEFAFPATVLALVFGSYTPGVLLTLFLLAPRAEEWGRNRILSVGMLLTIGAALLFATAPGVVELALARFVTGLAVGATTSVATAAMTDLEPYRDQHHVARVSVAANFGGFAVGVLASGVIAQFAPDPSVLVYVLPLVAASIGALGLKGVPETAAELGRPAPPPLAAWALPPGIRRAFWVSVGGLVGCYSVYGFFAALVPSYLRTDLGVASPLELGAVIAALFGTAAGIQLLTPQLRDRRALLLGFPTLLATLLALVLILPVGTALGLALVALALGVGVGLAFMGSVTLVDRVTPEAERGPVLARFYSAGYLALAVPTFGVAAASVQIGLPAAGMAFGAILAVGVAFLYAETYRTPTPPGGGGRRRESSAGPPIPSSGAP